jgi:PilZ domain
MNRSAEKRKMPRMQLGLSASIYWGIANNRVDVNIQNLSIHGISFLSKRNFTEGAQFHLDLRQHKKESGIRKIQAEVVRCETLNGFSSDGRFQIGARFLFPSNSSVKANKKTTIQNPSHLQPIDTPNSLLDIYKSQLKTPPVHTSISEALPVSSVNRISIKEVRAKLIQSQRTSTTEETVFTSIQIKQARFISSPSLSSSKLTSSAKPLAGIGKVPISAKLIERVFPEKLLS